VLSIDWATPAAKVNRVMESLFPETNTCLKNAAKIYVKPHGCN